MAQSRDYSAPSETRDARCCGRVRARIDEKKMAVRCKGEGEDWEGKIKGGGERKGNKRRSCPPSEGASKGNFTKADPLVMNVI